MTIRSISMWLWEDFFSFSFQTIIIFLRYVRIFRIQRLMLMVDGVLYKEREIKKKQNYSPNDWLMSNIRWKINTGLFCWCGHSCDIFFQSKMGKTCLSNVIRHFGLSIMKISIVARRFFIQKLNAAVIFWIHNNIYWFLIFISIKKNIEIIFFCSVVR